MSVLGEAAHLTAPRSSLGYGGFAGYGLGYSHPAETVLPLWRPYATPPPSLYCPSPSCPCFLANSLSNRPYMMADCYDYYTASLVHAWPSWYLKAMQDPQYKGPAPPPPPPAPLDCRESPCKELPTKLHKQERIKERLELSQPLNFNKDHALKHSRKCAGTQTQVSNVSHDMYINGDGKSTSVESYSVRHSLLTRTVSSPSSSHTSSPPRYHHDVHDAPLNLSLSSSTSHSSADSPTQSRPSVITCASTKSNGSRFENGPHSPSRREVSSVDVCDPAIEEHFRRSLGRNYPEYLASKSSHQSPPPTSSTLASTATSNNKISTTNVTITESVDDHFAKSLGSSTWSAIKARTDPAQDLLPGSVDDHFAKALGDTWLRIKAEKEGRVVGGLPLPPPYPHSHPLSHPHQHTSSHPHPPRPSSPQSQKVGSSMVST